MFFARCLLQIRHSCNLTCAFSTDLITITIAPCSFHVQCLRSFKFDFGCSFVDLKKFSQKNVLCFSKTHCICFQSDCPFRLCVLIRFFFLFLVAFWSKHALISIMGWRWIRCASKLGASRQCCREIFYQPNIGICTHHFNGFNEITIAIRITFTHNSPFSSPIVIIDLKAITQLCIRIAKFD